MSDASARGWGARAVLGTRALLGAVLAAAACAHHDNADVLGPLAAACVTQLVAPVSDVRPVASDSDVAVHGAGQFPVLARLGGDTLAVVFRGAGGHINQDGRLDLIISADRGRHWGRRIVAVDTPLDDRNAAFGGTSDGDLVLGYAQLSGFDSLGAYVAARARINSFVIRSHDRGITWTPSVPLDVDPFEWSSPYGKIIESDGDLVMGMYGGYLPVESDAGKRLNERSSFAFIVRSHDGGHSWSHPEVIGQGLSEPALLAPSSGVLLAAARINADSSIELARWTRASGGWTLFGRKTVAGELPGDLIQLDGGTIMLSDGLRRAPYEIRARLSSDSGLTWGEPFRLATTRAGFDFGYPSTARFGDSLVTVFYTDSGPAASRALHVLHYAAPQSVSCAPVLKALQ